MLESISNKVIPYRMNLLWLAKRWGMEIDSFKEALVQFVSIDQLKIYTSYQGHAIYGYFGYSNYESPQRHGAKWYKGGDLEGWYSQIGANTSKAFLDFSTNKRDIPDYLEKLMQLDKIRYEAYLIDREFIPEVVEVDGMVEMLSYENDSVLAGSLYVDESMGDGDFIRLCPLACKGDGQEAVYKRINLTLDLESTFIYRDDLKNFEQSQGWFDHGISLKNEDKGKILDTREKNSYLYFIKSLCEYNGINIDEIKAKKLEVYKDEGKDFSISIKTAQKILNELKKS